MSKYTVFITRIFVLLYVLYMLPSCDGTKFLADDELLLTHNVVASSDASVDVSSCNDYIIQKPNTKWFSALKVPLGIYSLSGRDSTKTINKLLRKWGEAPVVYDTTKTVATALNLRNMMANRGYLDAEVRVEQGIENKRIKVCYNIVPRHLYSIRTVNYNITDHTIDSLLRVNNILTDELIKQGDVFTVTGLQAERKRIATWLVNNGYRFFNKEAITYNVDSCKQEHFVDITMNIGLFRRSSNEELHEHPRYHIRNIIYEAPTGAVLKIKNRTLDVNTIFREGELYNDSKVQKTYNRFSRFKFIRSTNISFVEVEGSNAQYNNHLLDARVSISQHKPHSIQIQPEGTNTAGDLGAALSLTYENRNVFHGCEIFSLQARGAFEAIKGLEGYSDNNYEEYGIEAKLAFPEMLLPGISRNYRRRHTNITEFLVSYNRQNRPEFHRRVFTGTWRYRWSSSTGRVGHTFDVLDLNYVSMPWISQTFKENYLDSHDSRNAILRYNYEDLFIMKIGYGINYNDGINYFKFNIETAGNLLCGMSRLFRFSKNDQNQYKFAFVAFAQYAKVDADYTYNYRIDQRNTLAMHCRLGIAVPYGNSSMLPYEKRYFSGGANSVRGWSVRELGPGSYRGTDGRIDFINQTGDIRIDLNAELRSDLFWKFQGALFIDAGNIWTIRKYEDQPGGQFTIGSIYKEMAVAYGVGLRLNFDYFILRLDLGMKAINPNYINSDDHYAIIHPNFKRDYTLHFAVGLPF